MSLPAFRRPISSSETETFKKKLLQWGAAFDPFVFLDNNNYKEDKYHSFECIAGIGAKVVLEVPSPGGAFEALKKFRQKYSGWMLGYFSYDLKNEIENLQSKNWDELGFPALHFFIPKIIIFIKENFIYVDSMERDELSIYNKISNFKPDSKKINKQPAPDSTGLVPRILKNNYLQIIDKIKEHIVEGDIYEMNFCQEFYQENFYLNPLEIFEKLNANSHAPHSAFYKMNEKFLLCASPERFLKKEGMKLIAQPIKGTRKRGRNIEEDKILLNELSKSKKDQAENIMIVDLMRNDLSRSCLPGTVRVEELFSIYTFRQVHQMISTITGELKSNIHFIDAIKNAFPMGSMTGAPKVKSMELIEHYEKTKRGLYSGAVGYISPEGNFDFNVVIRSILYNKKNNYVSASVGGAIVYDSDPQEEYEECLTKSKAMHEALK